MLQFGRKQRNGLLRRESQTLERKLADKRDAMNQHPETPILPDDVWYHILEFAHRHRFPECHAEKFASRDVLISFSLVSRRCRAIALSACNLWTCIHISLPTPFDPFAKLEAQLARSRDRPLTVLLCGPHMQDPKEPASAPKAFWDVFTAKEHFQLNACWQLLLTHARRWRRLTFYGRYRRVLADTFTRNVLLCSNIHLPLLEHLEIYASGGSGLDSEGQITPLEMSKLNTPALKCLRVHNVAMVSSGPLRFSLTELVLIDVVSVLEYSTFAAVIGATATSLRTLIMNKIRLSSVTLGSPTKFCVMPRLRHLFIGNIGEVPEYHGILLFHLVDKLPQLLRLDLASASRISYATAFLGSQQFPSVRTLGLSSQEDHRTMEHRPFRRLSFLWPFPELRHLLVVNSYCEAFIRTLHRHSLIAIADGRPTPWPSLMKMTLINDNSLTAAEPEFYEVLEEYVRHRVDTGHPLQALEISTYTFERKTLDALKAQVEVTEAGSAMDHEQYFAMTRWGPCDDYDNNGLSVPNPPLWNRALDLAS